MASVLDESLSVYLIPKAAGVIGERETAWQRSKPIPLEPGAFIAQPVIDGEGGKLFLIPVDCPCRERWWVAEQDVARYREDFAPIRSREPRGDQYSLYLLLSAEQNRAIEDVVARIGGKFPAVDVEAAIAYACREWVAWYDQLHGHALPAAPASDYLSSSADGSAHPEIDRAAAGGVEVLS